MKWLLFLCAFLLVSFVTACKTKPIVVERYQPLAPNQIGGNWFGFAQGDLSLYYITLDSTNSFGSRFSQVSKGVSAFRIINWSVDLYGNIVIRTAPESAFVAIEATMVTDTMFSGCIRGSTGWSNEINFYKESAFEERLKILKASAPPTERP